MSEVNPKEIKAAFDLGMDIEFVLYGIRYYLGAPKGFTIISWNKGESQVVVEDDSKVLDTEFNGNTINNNWRDIIILAM